MPGNIIRINNSSELDWYVGDSKMDELIDWLDENGVKTSPEISTKKIGFVTKLISIFKMRE